PDPPVANRAELPRKAEAGKPFKYQLSRPMEKVRSYTLHNGPKGLKMSKEGLIQWTPEPGQVGSHKLLVGVVTDKRSGADIYTVVVSAPGASTANEATDRKLPPDLDLVPGKEALCLSVQPAKLWKDPALVPLRKLAETNKVAAAGLARLKQATGMDPGDIERAVIIFWGKQANPNSVVLVTTVKPFVRPRILGMIGEEQREEKVGGKSVISGPKSEFALHLLNDRTFLYGRATEVKKLLKLPPRAARTEKWNAILRSAPRHALQIAGQHDLFSEDPKKLTPPPLQGLNPLLDAHTAFATLDAGKELRLTLQFIFNDAEQAKQGERAARQALELAAVFLNQFAAPFKKSAPGTLPPPLAKLLTVVPDVEAALKKATIRTKDSAICCDVVLASAGWPEALAAVGELFLASGNKSAPPPKSDKPAPNKVNKPKSPEEAEAALKKLGAEVDRDQFPDGKPIIGVSLVGKQVTDDDLVLLRPLTTLTELRLVRLRITDKGLVHLKDLKELDYLDLRGNDGITDTGLAHLKGLPKLKTLRLLGTRVSDKGAAEFKKARPEVNVVNKRR
ncbi:MAG: putative Ig domain-containing protein, partial [Gemmataceae bacterium]